MLVCQERFALDPNLNAEDYFQKLTTDVAELAQGKQVDIIGFSVGAFVAMQVTRINPNQVRSLHLISAAAPLEGGDFLDAMAGKAVFRLARTSSFLFKLLSHGQGLLAAVSAKSMVGMLFASAVGGDRALVSETGFRNFISVVLAECFAGQVGGYVRDVRAYVTPWESTLKGITVKTHLWHGELDNWSPIAMSEYLSKKIPGVAKLNRLEGLSHYSCLCAAAPDICREIGQMNRLGR